MKTIQSTNICQGRYGRCHLFGEPTHPSFGIIPKGQIQKSLQPGQWVIPSHGEGRDIVLGQMYCVQSVDPALLRIAEKKKRHRKNAKLEPEEKAAYVTLLNMAQLFINVLQNNQNNRDLRVIKKFKRVSIILIAGALQMIVNARNSQTNDIDFTVQQRFDICFENPSGGDPLVYILNCDQQGNILNLNRPKSGREKRNAKRRAYWAEQAFRRGENEEDE